MLQLDISVRDVIVYFTAAFAIAVFLTIVDEVVRQAAHEAAMQGVREEVMHLDMVLREMEGHYNGRRTAAASSAS